YTHNPANAGGADSFRYRVLDSANNATEINVAITVGTNNPPDGQADALVVDEGSAVTQTTLGNASLLDNDSDPDGHTITVASSTAPSHGTLVVNSNGTFTYTHDGSEHFTDQFQYTVQDQLGATETSPTLVSITIDPINDNHPVPTNDLMTVTYGETQTVLRNGSTSVLVNDTDADLGDTLTAILVRGPAKGTLTLNTDGTFSYVHAGVESGLDSFTYRAVEADGKSTLARVDINIVADTTPVVFSGNGQLVVHEGVADLIDLGASFNDVPGISFEVESGQAAFFSLDPNTGELTVNASAADVGNHPVTFKVSNQAGQSISKEFEIVVLPSNDTAGAGASTNVDSGGDSSTDSGDGDLQVDTQAAEPEAGDAAGATASATASAEALAEMAEGVEALWNQVDVAAQSRASAVDGVDVLVGTTGETARAVQPTIGASSSTASGNLAGLSLDSILVADDTPGTAALTDLRRAGQSGVDGQDAAVELSPAVTTATAATGFSLGYLLWLARSGFLLSTVLSALPAWRNIDPLPVLNNVSDAKDDPDDDDKSLTELTEKK
ncbi:MAG: Ig-like domain-containing protein, partial [Pseudomonadota bacterium]